MIQDTKEILSDRETQLSFGLLVAEHISSHATQVTTSVEGRPVTYHLLLKQVYAQKLTQVSLRLEVAD
jgi:hypothetical protein